MRLLGIGVAAGFLGILPAWLMAFAFGMMATPAEPQSTNCGPRVAVIESLATKYGETRQSMGLGNNNAVVEVFASLETGSWTITVTSANGITCLVASGEGFQRLRDAA